LAVAVIKRPTARHVGTVRKNSGYDALSADFRELGYLSVLPEFRDKKLGKKLTAQIVKEILSREPAVKIFSTTRKDSVRHILSLNGFHKEGGEWPSKEHPESNLDLWILGSPTHPLT
jgi:hypothetical protein